MNSFFDEVLWLVVCVCVAAMIMLGLGCAASHGGAACDDAAQRMQELSCLEGYAEPFDAVCEVIDPACVVEANSCTEARACRL